jgi:hypothetical protein
MVSEASCSPMLSLTRTLLKEVASFGQLAEGANAGRRSRATLLAPRPFCASCNGSIRMSIYVRTSLPSRSIGWMTRLERRTPSSALSC